MTPAEALDKLIAGEGQRGEPSPLDYADNYQIGVTVDVAGESWIVLLRRRG